MTDSTGKATAGRAIMGSPRRSRALGPSDEKFALGDLVADVPDELLDDLAEQIGYNLKGAHLRSYRRVSQAWPEEHRAEASWTTHRTLKDAANRFDLIEPGMTLRAAQAALGKNPADTEHPSRWSLDRRVPFIINQLLDKVTTKAVREELDGRKKARSAKAALKMVEEDQSAEYRLALRQLREARDAKHPERAAYDALFKIREAREYVRAIGKATGDEDSFVPEHLRPDLVAALRDLATASFDSIDSFGTQQDATREALTTLKTYIDTMQPREVSTAFDGRVIQHEVNDTSEPPARWAVIEGGRA